MNDAVLTLDLPFAERLASGKVREIFALGSDLMLVATDRISAFDVVMREGVPGKGRVLTETTAFWLRHLADVVLHMQGITRSFVNGPSTLRVLRGLDLTVRRGEWVAIIGASGSGKSTTILACRS